MSAEAAKALSNLAWSKGRNQVNNKKLSQALLILLALLLVGGMMAQYTPAISSLFSGRAQTGTPAIQVGKETVTVQDLDALRRNNPVLNAAQSGLLGDDLKRATVAVAVQQAQLKQGSAEQEVSRSEVNTQVDDTRKNAKLTDNKAWTDRLAQVGLTDAAYREQVRDSLKLQKQEKSIRDAAPKATEEEIKTYYDLNPDQFQTEARIVGREIAVSDRALAQKLLSELRGGADFSTLASQYSQEFKDRGGALGPVKDSKPSPVSQAALPDAVGQAAFGLSSGETSGVLESGGKFYIVKVEERLAASTKPLSEVRGEVSDLVNKAKQNAALEQWADGLKKATQPQFVDPAWKVSDPAVASVNGVNIPYSELVLTVLGNQQFQSLMQQMPAEQASALVNQYLKPGATEQLIEQYAAPIIVKAQQLHLVGPRAALAQQLMAYGARNVTVSDDDIIKAYQSGLEQFTSKASGTVSEAVFNDKQQALAFRQDFDGQNFVKAASKAGGTVSERGNVSEGDAKLSAAVSKAVFGTQELRAVSGGSLSDVVEENNHYTVAYVTQLQPATVKPLSAVRDTLRQQLLSQKRDAAGQAYLREQLKSLKVENHLSSVLAEQQKAVSAAEAKGKAQQPSSAPQK